MTSRTKGTIITVSLVALAVGLCVAFPVVLRFVEGAAMELRRFWWMILIFSLLSWLYWAVGKRNPS